MFNGPSSPLGEERLRGLNSAAGIVGAHSSAAIGHGTISENSKVGTSTCTNTEDDQNEGMDFSAHAIQDSLSVAEPFS